MIHWARLPVVEQQLFVVSTLSQTPNRNLTHQRDDNRLQGLEQRVHGYTARITELRIKREQKQNQNDHPMKIHSTQNSRKRQRKNV